MNIDKTKDDPTLRKNRNGWWETSTHRQCTNCKTMFEKNSGNTSRLCKNCNTTRVKEESAEVKMYRRAKSRARIQGIPFTLVQEDIIIPTTCPVLGIPIYVTKGKSGGFNSSPSLDQINPGKGYTPDNIMVMSQLANAMKANATPDQLLIFSEWVQKTYSGEDVTNLHKHN